MQRLVDLSINYHNLKLVPIDELPSKGENIRIGNSDGIELSLVEIYNLSLKMEEICEQEKGIGLSAVQLGVPLNLFVVKGTQNSRLGTNNIYNSFLNCGISKFSDKIKSIEGCLSIREDNGNLIHFAVERYNRVWINGYRLLSEDSLKLEQIQDFELSDYEAIVFQHEIDHSEGRLISDHGLEYIVY